MPDRYFLSSPVSDAVVTLADDQAHHLTKVMRAKPGDQVILFDGRGKEHTAEIESVSKKSVSLRIKSTTERPDHIPHVTVAVALPKGDRQKFLIEKLVELGANRLVPLQTERSVAIANEKAIERLKKQTIEATKQCGRAFLMEIEQPENVQQLIEKNSSPESAKLIADPYTDSRLSDLAISRLPVIVAVGPEGGFTNGEFDLFENTNWKKVCISPNVLRVETAAIAAVTLLRAR